MDVLYKCHNESCYALFYDLCPQESSYYIYRNYKYPNIIKLM